MLLLSIVKLFSDLLSFYSPKTTYTVLISFKSNYIVLGGVLIIPDDRVLCFAVHLLHPGIPSLSGRTGGHHHYGRRLATCNARHVG